MRNIINKVLNRYSYHPEAVIISCFFNPQNSPYRTKAFNKFYQSIKHLNYRIVEAVIGDSAAQLPVEDPNISRVYTDDLLWHKEGLLNKIISDLPKKYKYVYWVDADVIFTNKNWLVDGVKALQENNLIQPFKFCFHLEKDKEKPDPELEVAKDSGYTYYPLEGSDRSKIRFWNSFACRHSFFRDSNHNCYDIHGHVGFAWGARREILDSLPLYDKALIGGADHIMAHAGAGHILHSCITKCFSDDLDQIREWSCKFYNLVKGKIGYVEGDLYHIWHGDIKKRDYFNRIKNFSKVSKEIKVKDSNGLYTYPKSKKGTEARKYVHSYFSSREEASKDDGFLNSYLYGYITDDALIGTVIGRNPMGAILGEMANPGQDSPAPSNSTNSLHHPIPMDMPLEAPSPQSHAPECEYPPNFS